MVVLLLVMLTACAATAQESSHIRHQDLSSKMFTFPQETNKAHVRLTTSRQNLQAVSVCLRFLTDLPRSYSLFSLATPSATNHFLIFKGENVSQLFVKDIETRFFGHKYKVNAWQSICSTWDSASGVGQLWLDGKPSSRKFISSGSISGPIIIVLGQDQDSHGGGFDSKQSFVGMISDVHMWDYVIESQEIYSYATGYVFTPGNVLNWTALEFQIVDRVMIEDKQHIYQ